MYKYIFWPKDITKIFYKDFLQALIGGPDSNTFYYNMILINSNFGSLHSLKSKIAKFKIQLSCSSKNLSKQHSLLLFLYTCILKDFVAVGIQCKKNFSRSCTGPRAAWSLFRPTLRRWELALAIRSRTQNQVSQIFPMLVAVLPR